MNITPKENLNVFSSGIDSFYKQIGLGNMPSDWSTIDEILSMSKEELDRVSPQAASQIATILSQYGIFLQIKTNKTEAFICWCNQRLKYAPDKDKTELFNILEQSQTRKNCLNFLTRRIELLSDSFKQIARQ